MRTHFRMHSLKATTTDITSDGKPLRNDAAEMMERMMRAILPFRLHIATVDGTWKLSQNKDDAVRLAAADHIETGSGAELAALAQLVRGAKKAT